MSGTGLSPAQLTISPATHSFAETPVGRSSVDQVFTVTNIGDQPASAVLITEDGDSDQFAWTSSCGLELAEDATCTVTARFSPTSTGRQLLAISALYNRGSANTTLTGAGRVPTPAQLTISPTNHTFAVTPVGQSSVDQAFTVTNVGDQLASSLIVNASGDRDQFVWTSTFAPELAGHATCTVTARFSPTSTGMTSLILYVTSTGALDPTTVLIGIGQESTRAL